MERISMAQVNGSKPEEGEIRELGTEIQVVEDGRDELRQGPRRDGSEDKDLDQRNEGFPNSEEGAEKVERRLSNVQGS